MEPTKVIRIGMVSTTTKTQRLKRPDTRPNSKARSLIRRKVAEKQKIQDLRVTRVQKDARKERAFVPVSKDSNQWLNDKERYIKALKKKLQAIHNLIEKQDKGEKLDDHQLLKISRLSELMDEMNKALESNQLK